MPFALIKESGKPVEGYMHYIEDEKGKKTLLSINGTPISDHKNQFEGAVFTIEAKQ